VPSFEAAKSFVKTTEDALGASRCSAHIDKNIYSPVPSTSTLASIGYFRPFLLQELLVLINFVI